MGWFDYDGSDGQKKLDAIQRQHVSDEDCLKALVEAFLLREGKPHLQPSWRRLIHVLHKAGESHLAEKIKTNAEPHQGEWVEMIHMHTSSNTSDTLKCRSFLAQLGARMRNLRPCDNGKFPFSLIYEDSQYALVQCSTYVTEKILF